MSTSPAESSVPHIGTAEHFRWLHGVVKVVLVLNLLDATFTILWVGAGLAREANPLFEVLVRDDPLVFATTKLLLVALASLLLWRLRHRPLAVVAIFVSFLAYYLILLHHVRFLGLLVGARLFP